MAGVFDCIDGVQQIEEFLEAGLGSKTSSNANGSLNVQLYQDH